MGLLRAHQEDPSHPGCRGAAGVMGQLRAGPRGTGLSGPRPFTAVPGLLLGCCLRSQTAILMAPTPRRNRNRKMGVVLKHRLGQRGGRTVLITDGLKACVFPKEKRLGGSMVGA